MRLNRRVGLASLGVLLAMCARLFAAPALEVDKTEWKMGKVPRNESRANTFVLRNTGDEALIISQIRPSCKSCVDKIDGDTTIKPGESRKLQITYNAVDSFGEHAMSVTIHSNDPARPLVRLRLSVEVVAQKNKPLITVAPASIDIGVVAVGKPVAASVEVSNAGDAPLNILSLVPSGGCRVDSAAKDAVAPGAKMTIPIVITPRTKGIVQESLGIESNDPDRGIVEVRMEGYAREGHGGGLVIAPAAGGEPGKPEERRVSVTNGTDFRVTLVLSPSGGDRKPVTLEPGASCSETAGVDSTDGRLTGIFEFVPAAGGGPQRE